MSDLFDWGVDLFLQAWPVISATPLAYFVAALVGGILVSFWYRSLFIFYERRIDDYKQRLGEDRRENIYAKSTNSELKREILKLTIELETFGNEREIAMQRVMSQELGKGSEEERQRRWLHQSEESARITREYNERFLSEFSGKITALLKEAKMRVPPDQSKVDESSAVDVLLKFGLVGPHPVETIIAELKRLTYLFPLLDPKRWVFYWKDILFAILLFLWLILIILHRFAMCFADT